MKGRFSLSGGFLSSSTIKAFSRSHALEGLVDNYDNKIKNLLGPLPSAIVLQCLVLQCSCAAGLVCCSANVMQVLMCCSVYVLQC